MAVRQRICAPPWGLVPEAEIDSDIIESGEYVPVDLGYCLDGQLTGFEVLPLDECDIKDVLNGHQIENVMTAFNNLPVNLRLPAAKVLSQDVEQDFTEWQAYQICKAFEAGIEEDTIYRLIANPDLNHGQMRELRRIAEQMGLTSPDVSPYTKDMFKTLASGGYDVEKLRQTHGLMKAAKEKEISFDRDWLKLDSDQMNAVRYGLISDVPMDVLADYTDGSYSADHMTALNIALIEGMEKPSIERLTNPDLSIEQVWAFYQAITGGRFTEEQLDILCDPTRPVAVMEAMRTGLTFGVDAQTVLRLADGSFAPEQMESLYLAAAIRTSRPRCLMSSPMRASSPSRWTRSKSASSRAAPSPMWRPRRSPCRVPSSTLGRRARPMPSVAPNSMRRPRNLARHPPSSALRAMAIRPSSARSWSRECKGFSSNTRDISSSLRATAITSWMIAVTSTVF